MGVEGTGDGGYSTASSQTTHPKAQIRSFMLPFSYFCFSSLVRATTL